jgi:hydrogenase maturation protein HypF
VSATAARRRVRARVRGAVQGVGFRPHAFRLASELGLGGWVENDARGVVCEVEGPSQRIDAFFSRLVAEAPPLAHVEDVARRELSVQGERSFAIRRSERHGEQLTEIAPDAATCADCLGELWDPADRRYRYPFVNCTSCGPRFTIVRGVPYDRPLTTMAGFAMCEACRSEYENPRHRRFHAQPNACPACGPTVSALAPAGTCLGRGEDALAVAAEALREGRIVAVKGLGGYHLACVADDQAAVATLRARKHREDKPFALMARDLADALTLVHLGAGAQTLLASPERPIVLAPRRPGAAVAAAVAPSSPELGVMLPYSPLHHLLLADVATPLVVTSGNASDEPIAYRDEDAMERLSGIADVLLVHDRPIHMRTDDSVVRVRPGAGVHTLTLRRSRGYVPRAMKLPREARHAVLACGAELKSTFCLAKGDRAWVSHHIGDLRNWETLCSFRAGVEHLRRLLAVEPEVIAHDLHPDYLSTRYAHELDGTLVAVQHHHAHLAACLAEHGERGPVLAAVYDGAGLGTDGTIWGGELLVGDLERFERVGHLLPVALPGGDAAAREPWRMSCAWLCAATGREDPPLPRTLSRSVEAARWGEVARLSRSGLAMQTTSMGRLLDAAAALCGVRAAVNYEGQAAIELEAACGEPAGGYEMPVLRREEMLVIDPRPALLELHADVERDVPVRKVASRLHAGVAAATVSACERAASARGLDSVVLSGGVFQNRLLLEATEQGLRRAGLRVLIPEALPPNDGGIAYGQAAIAAALEAQA